MARPRKIVAPAQTVEKPEIIADNVAKPVPVVSSGEENILIACHLAHGIAFDDVPDGKGGTKTIVFPSINQAAGNGGILVGTGKAVAIQISKRDWENIKRMHGREIAFTGRNGGAPCIVPMKDQNEFRARQNEIISEMQSGLEPLTETELSDSLKL